MSRVLALQKGIRFCVSGEQVILLDLRTERYFALPSGCNDAFRRWLTDEAIGEPEMQYLQRLVQKDILCVTVHEQSRADSRTLSPDVPTNRIDTSLVRSSPWRVVEAIGARMVWAWRAKHWRFKRQVHHLENVAKRRKRSQYGEIGAITRAFELSDLILGSHDKCMERSFAMVSVLRKYGVSAQAIIGVQNAPFAAHCWVQDGETVLNEEPDRVQLFTPILVI